MIAATAQAGGQSSQEMDCALRVSVATKRGQPINATFVELIGPKGNLAWAERVTGSEFSICDFGFGKHYLRVGTNECYPVTISNIVLHPRNPVKLKVTLNECGGHPAIFSMCEAYLRIRDSSGQPIEGVEVASTRLVPHPRSDRYGRMVFPIQRGDHTIRLVRTGFQPLEVQLACVGFERAEREIIMASENDK
jgi:hypothetical protein